MLNWYLYFIPHILTYRLVYQKVCNFFTFLALWILYLSLYKVGQTFMYFQWDIMLLESGFITIIVAPIIYSKKTSTTPKDQISFWLVKWLLFRLMFASGVVKLTSKCPTWWGLSGIHFLKMCFKLQSLNCKLFLNTLFYQPCHFILNHNAFQHHLHGTSTSCPFGFINCQ